MRRLIPSVDTFDGNSLLPVWDELDALEGQLERADDWYRRTQVLSDRRLDGAHRAGRRAYIEAHALIGKARESQLLLAQTMTTPGVNVFPHATANIIRPALEAAARALFILDGETTQERRFRGLRISVEDHSESKKWAQELMLPLFMGDEEIESHRSRQARITKRFSEDAESLSIHWGKVTNKINFRDEIGKFSHLRSNPELAAFLRAIWRRMSGVQHGMSYASLLGNEKHDQVEIPGGVEVLLLTDDDTLLTECRASALMQRWAMEKYIQRTYRLTR